MSSDKDDIRQKVPEIKDESGNIPEDLVSGIPSADADSSLVHEDSGNEETNINSNTFSQIVKGKIKNGETDSVKQYISYISSIREADRKEIGELWERVRRGDRRAKDRIFELNLRLVIPIAKKFLYSGADILDLIEEGNLGLYHAITKYDPSYGYRFSTYASYWIEQHIRRAVEESSKTIRIPPHAWTSMRKWQREFMALQEKLGRMPDVSEMARHLGWTEAQVRSAMSTADIVNGMSSIDAPRTLGGEDTNTLEDTLHGGPEDTPEHLMTETNKLEVLKKALGELDPREREILEARHGLLGEDPKTLSEIGKSLNLSRERVRQLESRALQTLRRAVISLGLVEDGQRTVGRRHSTGNKKTDSRLEVLSIALTQDKKHKSNLRILKIPRRK